MKNIRKMLALVFAGALAFTAVPTVAQAAINADELADGTAYLSINNADWGDYEAENVTAEITGDGQYTVSVTAAEAQELAQFNALQIKNGEALFGHEYTVTVDEIKINGETVTLEGESYTCSADGAGVDTRVNIYNEWNSPTFEVSDSLGYVDDRTAGDQAAATAKLIADSYLSGLSSIEVTFTVANAGAGSPEANEDGAEVNADADGAAAEVADPNATYHAYLAIQGPKFTFRDAWNNAATGITWEHFNQITKQGDTAGGESVPGTINDTEINGTGKYTVSITGIEWPDDEFTDQDHLNIIGLNTDIPVNGASVRDIKLTIDGRDVSHSAVQTEDAAYVDYAIQNAWNDDPNVQQIGFYTVPFSDISVEFILEFDGETYTEEEEIAEEIEEAVETAEETVTETAEEVTESVEDAVSDAADTATEAAKSFPVVPVVIAVIVVAAAACGIVLYNKNKKK